MESEGRGQYDHNSKPSSSQSAYSPKSNAGKRRTSSNELLRQGGQAPRWSRSSQKWFPQLNGFPHTRSQTCQPSSSIRATSAPARFLPFPLAKLASDAKGQQIRVHWCRPQALSAPQGRSQSISVSGPVSPRARARARAWSSKQRISLVVEPHRHGRTSMMEHGGQGPVWHFAEHTCSHPSRGFMQVDWQVGIGSVQEIRVKTVPGGKKGAESGVRACLPHGQCVTSDGELGQGGGVTEGGWHDFLQWCIPHSNGLTSQVSICGSSCQLNE